MESSLTRLGQRVLARIPGGYLAVLKILRRASIEKRTYISLLRKGDIVIDAGANVGYFTMLFSDLVGARGHVYAFEPVPSTFRLLSKNVSQFPHYKNVSLICAALGDYDQKTRVFLPDGDHGQAALVRHCEGSWKNARIEAIEIEMVRLDGYAEKLRRMDFLKCDVEGAELLVLRGGESSLRHFRPTIFLELDAHWTASFGWAPGDVIQFLRSIGYRYFYEIEPKARRIEKERFSGNAMLASWQEIRGLA
jgi:FkbM family methyltransferase